MRLKKPFFIALLGPTGVGKTDFALQLGTVLPIEIVNGDVGQFYTPLTVGTAKPDWRTSAIPHHLFDIIDEPRNCTVVEYRTLLLDTLTAIWERGCLPVVVGGSGFYLKSLLYPPVSPHQQPTVRQEIEYSWELLNKLDPERALVIAPGDLYRIARALDIIVSTQRKASEFQPVYAPIADYLFIFLTRDRQELYERINQRTQQMLEGGFIEEVARLKGTDWEPFLREKKMIGYDDLLDYLDSAKKVQDRLLVGEKIAQRTRNYAKRQITFWRSLQEQIAASRAERQGDSIGGTTEINLTLSSSDLYINQLAQQLIPLFKEMP